MLLQGTCTCLTHKHGILLPPATSTVNSFACVHTCTHLQVLGRNLEAVVNRGLEFQTKWGDAYCSVEHLLLGMVEDARFGEALLKAEGLNKDKLEKVWGSMMSSA